MAQVMQVLSEKCLEYIFLYWDDGPVKPEKKMAKSKPVKKGSKVVKSPLKKGSY